LKMRIKVQDLLKFIQANMQAQQVPNRH
jgi:hypothetical protein